jgi:hypothetical protein
MLFDVSSTSGTAEISLRGRMQAESAQHLVQVLEAVLADGRQDVVIDVRGLEGGEQLLEQVGGRCFDVVGRRGGVVRIVSGAPRLDVVVGSGRAPARQLRGRRPGPSHWFG